MDTRAEEGLGGIDVAHADDDALVHQELLHGDLAAARPAREVGTVEPAVERLRAEVREQRMLERVAGHPVQAAEAARVVEAQATTVFEPQFVVVVLEPRRIHRHDAQAARHAEMRYQRAAIEFDQQVLGAPAHVTHCQSRQSLRERAVHRPAQLVVQQHELDDAPAAQGAPDAAAGGFDFG